MRTYLVISLLSILITSCLTVDPPRPTTLGAPTNIKATICDYDSTNDVPGEFIRISWIKNSDDTISTATYTILSSIDTTDTIGTPVKVTNIPADINTYFAPVNEVYKNIYRDQERAIAYTVFGIDTLGRSGDTAALCTVNLAPSVLQSSPGATISDTLTTLNFKWFVRKVQDQTITSMSLWRENIKIWTSESDSLYTGGADITPVSQSLPDSLSPLSVGQYKWIVSFRIINGIDEPQSFTAKELNVLKE